MSLGIPSAELDALSELTFDFVKQPDPVPASLRPERRVPLSLLLVAKARKTGASWKGLQLLNWALREPANLELLLALRSDDDIPGRPIVRFEPALDRALDLATGLGLLEQKAQRMFLLTGAGRNLIRQVEQSGALAREREMLDRLEGKLANTQVQRAIEWRDR